MNPYIPALREKRLNFSKRSSIMPKPTDYVHFYLKVSKWKGESLRYFAKRETNEQTYDTAPGPLIHQIEPKTWICCKKQISVRDYKGNLQQCVWCLKTYYDPRD
jgi:hypothetical protein